MEKLQSEGAARFAQKTMIAAEADVAHLVIRQLGEDFRQSGHIFVERLLRQLARPQGEISERERLSRRNTGKERLWQSNARHHSQREATREMLHEASDVPTTREALPWLRRLLRQVARLTFMLAGSSASARRSVSCAASTSR